MGVQQIIAHLIGDYVLQSHWMANSKTSASLPCLIHVTLYCIPFLLFGAGWSALLVIGGTHFIIDRWRLAQYWVDFWGTGKMGSFTPAVFKVLGIEQSPELHLVLGKTQVGDAPAWLGVWLLIIVDNTMHLTINFLALKWL